MSAALSAGLVLLATALLVVGLLVDDGLALVGLSLATSVAAATVLLVVYRRSGRVEAVVTDG